MKKFTILSLIICFIFTLQGNAQVGSFLKNVKNNVVKDLLSDKPGSSKQETAPEPSCACDDAVVGLDLNKYKIDYTEVSITVQADGTILVKSKISGEYFIVKDGAAQGPMKEGDPRLSVFGISDEEQQDGKNAIMLKNKKYISKSGDKFVINFQGKTYGPYARIDDFVANLSGTKFVAVATENVTVTEDEGKDMEKRMENAKNDAERMALAMEMTQKMQDNVMQAGAQGFTPEYISNIPGVSLDFSTTMGGSLTNKIKYDDILILSPSKVQSLTGKTLFNLGSYEGASDEFFVKSDNSMYAWFSYGTLTFSDGKKISDMFIPYLTKIDGQVYLAYMYYSPKRNALMLCKIPF